MGGTQVDQRWEGASHDNSVNPKSQMRKKMFKDEWQVAEESWLERWLDKSWLEERWLVESWLKEGWFEEGWLKKGWLEEGWLEESYLDECCFLSCDHWWT